MKLSLFTLCEGAFNHNGHLTIVNTIDFLNVGKLPFQQPLGVALKFLYGKEDIGKHIFKLSCIDPSEVKIVEIETTMTIADVKEEGVLCMTSNLGGLLFSHPGYYAFKVYMDNNLLGNYSLKLQLKEG